jgi:hypothetical protein
MDRSMDVLSPPRFLHRCAFSKHYPPENYVIGAFIGQREYSTA